MMEEYAKRVEKMSPAELSAEVARLAGEAAALDEKAYQRCKREFRNYDMTDS